MAIALHIRKKIADFDPVRDGKTVKQLCAELGISKQTYYNIRKRVAEFGPCGIAPGSTAPKNPRRRFSPDIDATILRARQSLTARGLDHGPWSIYYYLIDELGMEQVPSRSYIAKILHDLGVVDANARKRPRSSYRRFARARANELWQIDGLVYTMFDYTHTQVTIYQIIDDATRFDVGSQVYPDPENGHDARQALAAAFRQYGKPQEILSDNGEAFTAYHRGKLTATDMWLAQQGVWSIAGFKATTQGKDERSHQTMTQFLDAYQPTTIEQVKQHLETYRHVYNYTRRHQGLLVGKTHITPASAWQTWEHAPSPVEPVDTDRLKAKIARYRKQTWPAPHTADTSTENAAVNTPTPKGRPLTQRATAAPLTSPDGRYQVPSRVQIYHNGVLAIPGARIYVGSRFRRRWVQANFSGQTLEYYLESDGELLVSFPYPIQFQGPPKSVLSPHQITGLYHRQMPKRQHP